MIKTPCFWKLLHAFPLFLIKILLYYNSPQYMAFSCEIFTNMLFSISRNLGGGGGGVNLILPHPNFAFFGCPNEVN